METIQIVLNELSRHGDGTYAVFGSWIEDIPASKCEALDYSTVATPGNASSFGTLGTGRSDPKGATNNATRGVIAGGTANNWQESNVIEYITIASPPNATSFGTLTQPAYPKWYKLTCT